MQNTLELLRPNKNTAFPFDTLMGSLGQAVVETQLRSFGYEVYPYIYEDNRAAANSTVKKGYSDMTTTKIRSMPDLQAYDRETEETYLLHVKTTFGTDESGYWISKNKFESYKRCWSEAFFVIYFIPTAVIRCCKIGNIKNWTSVTPRKIYESNYHLDLTDFSDLPCCFPRIRREVFHTVSKDIRDVFKVFGYTAVTEDIRNQTM